MKQKYDDMEPVSKLQKLTKQKEARKVSASKMHNLDHYLTLFNKKKLGKAHIMYVQCAIEYFTENQLLY